MKYIKKPVVIEAIKWDGKNTEEVLTFLNSKGTYEILKYNINGLSSGNREKEVIKIETLEGTMTAQKGDYIIKGIKGEFYPCKPDIFEETYDKL